MLYALFKGIQLGLVLSVTFSLGPVFFSLLQTGLQRGFRSGALMAAGISISDLSYAFICQLGLSQLVHNHKSAIALVGGIIAVVFGIATMRKKTSVAALATAAPPPRGTFRYVSKGFLLNSVNPSVVLFWIGMASVASSQIKNNHAEAYVFLFGIIAALFSTDLLKLHFARRLKNHLNSRVLDWVNRVVGIALVLFGGWLVYSSFGPSFK